MNDSREQDQQSPEPEAIPKAIVRTPEQTSFSRIRTRLWWLTGICAILAFGLIVFSFRKQGKPIAIYFLDGYGLKAGDTLRFRGIDVGAVTGVAIAKDLQNVKVDILLTPGNERLAVEGSKFWIQRARLRLGQVTGLETVLGAKYVGVIPGDPSGEPKVVFDGLETPLAITDGETTEILIRFPAGEGLGVGDQVRFRGIAVGEVTFVDLNEGLESISVGVRMVGAARDLARAGTQFWIERPRLDLTEIRGLETLVGGRYIAIQPTSAESAPQTTFVGLAEPPPLPRRDGSLEVELDAPRRLGLVRGAPVAYRGLEVGRVSNVGLASDGASVKVAATIDAEYAELVRADSKWWVVGGIQLDASLSGVTVSIESLSSWIRGGIAFATPMDPGGRVVTGHRFMLEEEPQEEWLQWQPRIAITGAGTVSGAKLPKPARVVASWTASWLGLYRRRTEETWGLALEDNTLYVPTGFVQKASDAGEDVQIELAGKSFPLDLKQIVVSGEVAKLKIGSELNVPRWPPKEISKAWSSSTVLLIVNPELREPIAIDGTRIKQEADQGRLSIAPGVAIAASLVGSPVINSQSGKLVGLLTRGENNWIVAFL